MSAWAFLVGNYARTEAEIRAFDEALAEIQKTERTRTACEMTRHFGRLVADGKDGHPYCVQDWITRDRSITDVA